MSAPNNPTREEVESNDDWSWEYDQTLIDVSLFDDPPNSRPPLVNIRRRIVGPWEIYNEK